MIVAFYIFNMYFNNDSIREVKTSHPFARRFRCIRFFAVRKSSKNRIVILAVATIWDVLLDVFCSCVRDFYSPCPYGRYIYV